MAPSYNIYGLVYNYNNTDTLVLRSFTNLN